MKICLVGAEFFHADGKIDTHDGAKIFAFQNSAKAHKNDTNEEIKSR